jgi:hypothetical protein
MRKTGLRLVVAYLMVAGNALATTPTSTYKRYRNPVAYLKIQNVFSSGLNGARQFVTGHVG